MKINFRKEQGTVLMLVVVSAFIMSIVGMGTINLMGLQEIQARAELDVVRVGHVADAGIEYGLVWISSNCTAEKYKLFPENINKNFEPLYIGRYSVGANGYCDVSIVPDMTLNTQDGWVNKDENYSSLKGAYTLTSTATIVVNHAMLTTQHKSIRVMLEKKDGHFKKVAAPPPIGNQTNTLLFNGRVLIAGGDNGSKSAVDALGDNTLDTAREYDPISDSYTPYDPMAHKREKHTATALTSGSRVGHILIVGGAEYRAGHMTTDDQREAELYDPVTHKFSPVGSMTEGRSCHSTVMLDSGELLVMGGFAGENQDNPHSTAELFNPNSLSFSPTLIDMGSARHCFHGLRLKSGDVFLAGGRDANEKTDATRDCRIFLKDSYSFKPAGNLLQPRSDPAMIELHDGTVLIAGGWYYDEKTDKSITFNSAEIYNPSRNRHYYTEDRDTNNQTYMHQPRADIFFGELPNKKILIVGGTYTDEYDDWQICTTAEIYDPETGRFTQTDSPVVPRRAENNAMVKLQNGDLLLVGGWNGNDVGEPVSAAEVYSLDISVDKQANTYTEGPVDRNPS